MGLKIGTLAYSTSQGLAHLAWDFYRAGVVTDVFVVMHPHYPNHPDRYPGAQAVRIRNIGSSHAVREFVSRMDVMVFWETPWFWPLFDFCRTQGVKTALCVMHEWFPQHPPALPDLFLCPSLLDLDYFPGIAGEPGARGVPSTFLPVPVDPSTWRLREKATRFLHNAGHVGSRNHKGTEELLAAVPLIKSPIQLTIRSQTSRLQILLDKYPAAAKDPRVKIEIGDVPYGQLFDGYDCYLACEKYNGLSLPLQEAMAAGLFMITTDRYPTNTWVPRDGLVPVSRYDRVRVQSSTLEIDEAIVRPEDIAAKVDEVYGTDITAYSRAGREWAEATSWPVLKPKYLRVLEDLVGGQE